MLRHFTFAACCCVALLAVACSGGAGAGGGPFRSTTTSGTAGEESISYRSTYSEDDIKRFGSAKVWYSIDGELGGTGRSGARAKDVYFLLANSSHRDYAAVAITDLKDEEFLVPDGIMIQLMQGLRDRGLFDASRSRAVAIRSDPAAYAKTLRSKPYKWIAVDYNGQITFVTRSAQLSGTAADAGPWEVFSKCETLILSAKSYHEPKAEAGKGETTKPVAPRNPIPRTTLPER